MLIIKDLRERFRAWIDRRFAMEEINGGGTCPTYLYRWTLFRAKDFQLYLHHFVGDDWSLDLHDHPKRFISVGLRGGYVEETLCDPLTCPLPYVLPPEPLSGEVQHRHEQAFRAPWVRSFPAEHRHRLKLTPETGADCWTLVLVLNSPDAREHRSCP